jgi:hypothetical protein
MQNHSDIKKGKNRNMKVDLFLQFIYFQAWHLFMIVYVLIPRQLQGKNTYTLHTRYCVITISTKMVVSINNNSTMDVAPLLCIMRVAWR